MECYAKTYGATPTCCSNRVLMQETSTTWRDQISVLFRSFEIYYIESSSCCCGRQTSGQEATFNIHSLVRKKRDDFIAADQFAWQLTRRRRRGLSPANTYTSKIRTYELGTRSKRGVERIRMNQLLKLASPQFPFFASS